MVIIYILFLVCSLVFLTYGYTPNNRPFVFRNDLTGIWRLSQKSSLLPTTSTDTTGDEEEKDEILLSLNEDGTFDRYKSEGKDALNGMLGRGGCWDYRDDTLFLAPERPDDADPRKVHDTLLAGKLVIHVSDCLSSKQSLGQSEGENKVDDENGEIDVHLSISDGKIDIGRFMYPRKHKAFFDDPMLFQKSLIGCFTATQVLGNLNARLKSEREEETKKKVALFHKTDFHGRRFYLTATPHPVHEGYAKQDKRYDENKLLHDVRVLPIHFYSNNTFSAIGTEKILRGRYGLAGDERDRLWFQVSLFGAGRSAPGSVFSEGRLLSHDDRRGYLGEIQVYEQNNKTMMFVRGEFYYGTDLKRAIKPNSMGVFTMQEINASDDDIENLKNTATSREEEEEEEEEEDIGGFWEEDAFQ